MKSTGIVRKIDSLGRIVVPKELRKTLGISIGDPVEIFVEGQNIVLRRYNPGCAICGSLDDICVCNEIKLCRACIQKVAAKYASEDK